MPRYYFHLWTGDAYELDATGLEVANAEAAYLEAFQAAQDICAEMIRERKNPLRARFEITDHNANTLSEVAFSELIKDRPRAPSLPEVMLAQIGRRQADTLRLHREVVREICEAQQTLRDSYRTLALSRAMGF
jgi:hypothetical protein